MTVDARHGHWDVVIEDGGRAGYLWYREGPNTTSLEWEFGGGTAVAIIWTPLREKWDRELPWAAGRRAEIMRRVASEVIRQRAPGCHPEFGDDMTTVVLREPLRREA